MPGTRENALPFCSSLEAAHPDEWCGLGACVFWIVFVFWFAFLYSFFVFVFLVFQCSITFYCYFCCGILLLFHRFAIYPASTRLRDQANVNNT